MRKRLWRQREYKAADKIIAVGATVGWSFPWRVCLNFSLLKVAEKEDSQCSTWWQRRKICFQKMFGNLALMWLPEGLLRCWHELALFRDCCPDFLKQPMYLKAKYCPFNIEQVSASLSIIANSLLVILLRRTIDLKKRKEINENMLSLCPWHYLCLKEYHLGRSISKHR